MHERAEFRQDIVSGDWVLIAPNRGKRPEPNREQRLMQPKETCPFEDPQATGHGQPVLAYRGSERIPAGGDLTGWTIQIIPNKYPALTPGAPSPDRTTGLFKTHAATGHHELLITRDHDRSFAQFSTTEVQEVVTAYRERYREIAAEPGTVYVLIFHNHGLRAGASLSHNHSQIISLPILPPEIKESMDGAERYWREYGRKPHDLMLAWELEQGTRIVYQNERFVVLCPYVSKTPYELRIFPRDSSPYFEHLPDSDLPGFADALSATLRAVHDALGDPDYNFYIHTAPVARDPEQRLDYEFYHWHVEVMPRIKVDAGFELGTAISINQVDPDDAAEHLREAL